MHYERRHVGLAIVILEKGTPSGGNRRGLIYGKEERIKPCHSRHRYQFTRSPFEQSLEGKFDINVIYVVLILRKERIESLSTILKICLMLSSFRGLEM